MPRCSHCGKVNREGSLFCQDCGHRLEASPAPAAKPAQAGPVCGACGTANPPGMNFCKMCGTSLAAKPVEAQPAQPAKPAAPSGKVTCPSCGKQTPAGFSFCQHCGQRLASAQPAPSAPSAPASPSSIERAPAASPAQPVAAAQVGTAATMAQVTPTPPAGMPRGMAQPSAAQPAARVSSQAVASEEAMARTVAPPPSSLAVVQEPRAKPAKPTLEPYKSDTLVESAGPRLGTLVAVRRDGSDGDVVPLYGETFDIGRTEGALNFAEDSYLAARHARLLADGNKPGKVLLRPLDAVNGVFVRVQGAIDLAPGDQFLVGKELLRFEPLAPEERDPPSLIEHGVRLFGSAPREAWGRLRQLTVAGTTRDLWHLTRPELVLGREEGDVTFPDDEFMSRRHAAIKRVGAKARLEDLSSSNGTFLRIRGDRELRPGDVLRLGDQLLRFEP
ncbi:MAG TPA: zinc ribbon domain-containing protein [Polyangia bacterium]|jgi:hypothetical protein